MAETELEANAERVVVYLRNVMERRNVDMICVGRELGSYRLTDFASLTCRRKQ